MPQNYTNLGYIQFEQGLLISGSLMVLDMNKGLECIRFRVHQKLWIKITGSLKQVPDYFLYGNTFCFCLKVSNNTVTQYWERNGLHIFYVRGVFTIKYGITFCPYYKVL